MAAPKNDAAGIRQAIRALRAAGYTLQCVDDGGDENVNVSTERDALDAITAVDDAYLIVNRPEGNGRAWIRFVMGNEPEEVICDYVVSLEPILDPLIDTWN